MKAKQNFALPTITSTYSGEAASGFIAAALLSANTLDKKLVSIMPNVKYKSVIQKLDVSGIVQDASCDFSTSGSVAISERILEPKELQLALKSRPVPKSASSHTDLLVASGSNDNGKKLYIGLYTIVYIPLS